MMISKAERRAVDTVNAKCKPRKHHFKDFGNLVREYCLDLGKAVLQHIPVGQPYSLSIAFSTNMHDRFSHYLCGMLYS